MQYICVNCKKVFDSYELLLEAREHEENHKKEGFDSTGFIEKKPKEKKLNILEEIKKYA